MVPPQACCFFFFWVGLETRSIVAHNINKRMQQNQFGGCAMMVMGTISPKVIDSGVDFTGLGQWCWVRIELGTKKTRIVIAYQPYNSGWSAGTTVKDQQSQYFRALGDAQSPRTIFFEQLISQLLVWKKIVNDIVLLGNFNKNVYLGRLSCCLSQDDLKLSEICHKHTGVMIPPTFCTGSAPINVFFCNPWHWMHKCSNSAPLWRSGQPQMFHCWFIISVNDRHGVPQYCMMLCEKVALYIFSNGNHVQQWAHKNMRQVWECLTAACKALSLANAKGKGVDELVIRSFDD